MPENEGWVLEEAITIDDEIWEALIELSGGTAALCYQCGVCTATCPWGMVKGEPLSVRSFMRQAQLGLQNGNESLWLCTTCAQCEAYCPRGVHIAEVFRGLRSLAWQRRAVQPGLPSLLWSVYWNNNPWSQPPSQRTNWATNLEIPQFNPHEHDILLYIGCTSSYDRRAQKIARALVNTLQACAVPFGYLGEDEPCCGEAALGVGHKAYFEEIAQHTAKVFREQGVTQLVCVSPHCYDVFKNHYTTVNLEFQPWHYTQFLAQLVDQGQLRFEKTVNHRVTFQDPCYLGRHNQEYRAPRHLLSSIPGLELVEMANSGVDGLCCGGGGGRMWLETAPGERFSDLRVKEAAQTGADFLVTACPFCLVCLEDSLKAHRANQMTVLDIAELTSMALAR